MPDTRLSRALAAIDARNADDPHTIAVRGVQRPKELAHAELVTEWVRRLQPDPSEALLLAARAHHIRRWEIPRSSYPDGNAGYHRWRRTLQDFHARELRAILEGESYDESTIARSETILRKRELASDPEVQVLEDALCLVFLETQLVETAAKVGPEKAGDVLEKTLAKMSPRGRELARSFLPPLDADRLQ